MPLALSVIFTGTSIQTESHNVASSMSSTNRKGKCQHADNFQEILKISISSIKLLTETQPYEKKQTPL